MKGENAIEVNDKLTLTCQAASIPRANYTWMFNKTLTDVKTDTYTIEKAVYKNTGLYTCIAHNSVTGKTTEVTHSLSVKGKTRVACEKLTAAGAHSCCRHMLNIAANKFLFLSTDQIHFMRLQLLQTGYHQNCLNPADLLLILQC